MLVCVTGASGSGKSSLIHEIVQKQLVSKLHDSRVFAGLHDELTGYEYVTDVINIDQSPIGRSSRSNPATYLGFYDTIRKVFAATDEAVQRGFTASTFSFNVKGGRCEECSGEGSITTQLSFMPDIEVTCPTCKGARYSQDTLEVQYRGRNIAEVLDMSVEDGLEFFASEAGIAHKIRVLRDLGLGYLQLGHPSTILSGGEAQRVKLAGELSKLKRGNHNLYILDEPTTGLHFADIERLLDSLIGLVNKGHSVVVIEHNLDVIKMADYVIDLGPEGGHRGGQLIACGTPEEIAASPQSQTGRFLREYLTASHDGWALGISRRWCPGRSMSSGPNEAMSGRVRRVIRPRFGGDALAGHESPVSEPWQSPTLGDGRQCQGFHFVGADQIIRQPRDRSRGAR